MDCGLRDGLTMYTSFPREDARRPSCYVSPSVPTANAYRIQDNIRTLRISPTPKTGISLTMRIHLEQERSVTLDVKDKVG